MRLKIAVTMFVLALLACGVPGAAEVEDIANEAATTAVEEIEEQTEAQTDAEDDAPTADEDSAPEPEEEPAEPTEADAPEPTAEPTPEQETAEEPGDDASAAAFPGADNNCSHPYFPVVDGATWTYESGLQGEAPETYVVTHREVTESSFEFVQVYEEGDFNITWQCTEAGLVQTQYATANVADEGFTFNFETLTAEGITFPEEFVPGASWTTTYEAVGDISGTETQYDFDITVDYTYVQDEEITVPAGTFTAARVEQTITIASSALGTETAVPATNWYVEGIGLVRNESEFSGFASYYELVSYDFPQ